MLWDQGPRSRSAAHYTSAQGKWFFGWKDAEYDDAKQLATKFIQRFAEIAIASRGDDWSYAGWYVRMLGYAERGMFPAAYADWYEEPDPRFLPLWGYDSDLPMPPPGGAEDRIQADDR